MNVKLINKTPHSQYITIDSKDTPDSVIILGPKDYRTIIFESEAVYKKAKDALGDNVLFNKVR